MSWIEVVQEIAEMVNCGWKARGAWQEVVELHGLSHEQAEEIWDEYQKTMET